MLVTLVFGIVQGGLASETGSRAILSLLLFYGIGYVAGWLSEGLIRQSVQARMEQAVANHRRAIAGGSASQAEGASSGLG
jgi:hypothetical protein